MNDRVLLLSHAFPPMSVAESYVCAKRMGNLPGLTTDVVCAQAVRPWMGNDPDLLDYVNQRFGRVIRVRAPWGVARLPLGLLWPLPQSPDIMRLFNRASVRAALSILSAHHVAMVTSSQWHSVHLAGLAIKRKHPALPWIATFSDPWIGNPYMKWGPGMEAVNRRLQSNVLDAADRLVFTSRQTVDLMTDGHPEWAKKSFVLPHSFDPSLYREIPRPAGGPLLVRHIGAFYGKRSPEPLFQALAKLHAETPGALAGTAFELIGPIEPAMLASSTLSSLPKGLVSVRPPVSYLESLQLMKQADALLLVDAPAAESLFLPSKLIDYLGAGRPILGVTPAGAAADVLSQAGGRMANPADPAEIATALAAMIEDVRTGAPGKWQDVSEKFEAKAVGQTMVDIIRGARY